MISANRPGSGFPFCQLLAWLHVSVTFAKRSSLPPSTLVAKFCFTVCTTHLTATQHPKFESIWYFLCSSTTIHAQLRLPETMEWADHPKGSETSDIRNRCRWIQGLCATGRKDQLHTLPIKESSYKYHNYIIFSIQTHLFAVHSASVAFINWQSEEAIAVIVNREAAPNVQNGTSSSTYR